MAIPSYGADQMRNNITQALMNVQNPPPRTQMPGGGMGSPTKSPIVAPGAAASPMAPGAPAPGGAGGPQSPFAPPPTPGMPGMPGQGFAPPPNGAIGAPTVGPPQVAPPQMGGMPLPPPGLSQNIVGAPPPQAGQVPGTQLPVAPGQLGRY